MFFWDPRGVDVVCVLRHNAVSVDAMSDAISVTLPTDALTPANQA